MKTVQNFSMPRGDDFQVSLDIDPDVSSLVGSQVTWRVYAQDTGVAIGAPVLTKNLDQGLEITDPTYQLILITLQGADTAGLAPGNYYHEATVYDIDGKRTSVSAGILTLLADVNPAAKDW